ncbi:hypothetical protein V3C99_001156 [Haemonchus contortus]|uniref:Uncharacterized protein n=1 Tax=Haemonchus contortus TaxID=6289 RepID=A0A7I4YFL5_HAECO
MMRSDYRRQRRGEDTKGNGGARGGDKICDDRSGSPMELKTTTSTHLSPRVHGERSYEFPYKQTDRQTDRRTDRQTRALYIK